MSAFVQDATRFLLRHYQTIATWPLQVYSSAIVLSPQTSMVRVANLGKIPNWLRALPQVEEAWPPLVQTLRGHSWSVTAVAFSPDGKYIASGSLDKTVKPWDVSQALRPSRILGSSLSSHLKYRSKRETKTLQVVESLRYSGDGRKIFSNVGSFTVDDVASDPHDRSSTSLEDLRVSDEWSK